MKALHLLSIAAATLVCASPARAELNWLMRLDQPPLRVSPNEVVTITGTLINSPSSTEQLGVFTSGPFGPPGEYNMAVFAGVCEGWTFEVNGVHFVQQFVGVDLAPGETFDFILGQCIPPEGGYPNRSFSSFAQLQLVSRSLGRQVGTSTDYVRWLVSDEIRPTLSVNLLINPGPGEGKVNVRSDAPIQVAVLGGPVQSGRTEGLDATQVDPMSIQFGPADAGPDASDFVIEDVNKDGHMDLVLRFRTQETGLSCATSDAKLIGKLFDGSKIAGSAAIIPLGCGR